MKVTRDTLRSIGKKGKTYDDIVNRLLGYFEYICTVYADGRLYFRKRK